MRRLVVISRKSKLIATFAAMVFSLTSIHLAAKAHIASLQREQQQLERSAMQQPLALSQETVAASKPAQQIPANAAAVYQKVTAPKTQPNHAGTTSAAAPSTNPAPKLQIIISIADRQLAVIDQGQVLKTYPIAVGAHGTPSPDGDFVIINHAKDPVYRHGDKEIAPG